MSGQSEPERGKSDSDVERFEDRVSPAATIMHETLAATDSATQLSIGGREDYASLVPVEGQSDLAVLSVLGEGGMGRVLLARQRSLAREVAVKTLRSEAVPLAAKQLLREARITGALEHPGVVPIHVLASDAEGRPMLVMKRVDGVEFEKLLCNDAHPAWKSRGRSDDRLLAAIEILVQVCRTLEFAHSRGIVHLDIKPQNIMVGSFGEVYLLDWGIATMLNDGAPGDLVGTPAYMPPELARGEPVSERTDVYLVGATLHVILTGRPRHDGKTLEEILRSATTSEPFEYPEGVPEELADLCNRTTARAPEARPASVEALREELSAFIRHRTARALYDAALARLVDLETLLRLPGPPHDLARALRIATEARFGFALILREHASDALARSGMRRCLALAIELELRQDHAESAEALLREMEEPDAALVRRVDQVRERIATSLRERDRLARLDDELDPTQHSWKRGILLFGCCVIAVVLARSITLGGTLSPERVAGGSMVTSFLFVFGLFATRRRIFWNAFNRRLIALLVATGMMIVAHRLLAVVYRTPAQETMTIDLVIALGPAIFAGYAFMRRLALIAAPLVVGIGAALLWPSRAPVIAVASMALAGVIAAAVMAKPANSGATTKDGDRDPNS